MKIKLITFLVVICVALVTSCSYDEKDQIAGQGPTIIRMQVAPDAYGINFIVSAFNAVPETGTVIVINRDAVSSSDLSTVVNVDFAIDRASLDLLNDSLINTQIKDAFDADSTVLVPGVDDFDTFNLLPPDAYSWVAEGLSGNTLNFASGQFNKELQIALNPDLLDLSLKYIMPLALKSATGTGSISQGTGYANIQVIVKNQYDGLYHSFGFFGHPSSPRPIDKDKVLLTRGASRDATEMGDFGDATLMTLEIQPDNSVTVVDWGSSPTGSTLFADTDTAPIYPDNIAEHPWSYYDNAYHPDTKSFRLKYGYFRTSGYRTVTEEIFAK